MTRIFINYLAGDEENVAAMLENHLSGRFDSKVFFRASKSIPPGDDYRLALLEAVRTSNVVLAVIGVRWLTVSENGERKIDQAKHWTRREIVEAFRNGVRVIPILIGSVGRLDPKDLPEDLAKLATCQYVRLGHRTLERDLDLLAAKLMKLIPGLIEKDPPGGGPQVVNNVSGNAQVGIQGIVHGDPHFDFGGKS